MKLVNKATGREIQDFYVNHWPEGYYHDDCAIPFEDDNGWILEPETKYKLSDLGYLMPESSDSLTNVHTFQQAFNSYLRKRDYDIINVRIPKANRQEIIKQIETLGLKII